MAATTLLCAPSDQACLPREFENAQMAALLLADGCHALAVEFHGHLDRHIGGSF
jgi:hypothetical protein